MTKRNLFLLASLLASGAILLAVTALSIQTDRLAAAFGVVVSSSSSNAEVQALGINLWAVHAWRELLLQLTRPVAAQAI